MVKAKQTNLDKELQLVRNHLNREMMFNLEGLQDLIDVSMNEMDRNACPATVLAVNRACGYRGEKGIHLALAVELIYMADKVHTLIRDEDVMEEETQYPVLIGDFLYGKYFLTLCKEELLEYLEPLAQTIETRSQGSIERWLTLRDRAPTKDEWMGIADQELASLTGTAARLGADLAGAPVKLQEKMESMGRNLGMAWAAAKECQEAAIIHDALAQVEEIMKEVSDQVQIEPLEELRDFFVRQCD